MTPPGLRETGRWISLGEGELDAGNGVLVDLE